MSTPNTSTIIDATAAVPIDWASKLALGACEAARRWDRWTDLQAQRARIWWDRQHLDQRARIWWDRQHLDPQQVTQLVIVVAYGVVALIEAWAATRGGKR